MNMIEASAELQEYLAYLRSRQEQEAYEYRDSLIEALQTVLNYLEKHPIWKE